MHIHVCPLSALDELVAIHGPSHVVSLLGPHDMIDERSDLAPGRHLRVAINDIVEPGDGLILASADHAAEIVDFAIRWNTEAPMIIHCWAGISRSSAAAFITLCALNPDVSETDLAERLRNAAPFAKPNLHLVSLGDGVLGRSGRMQAAVEALPDAGFRSIGQPFQVAARQPA